MKHWNQANRFNCLELLDKLLQLDPLKRLNASQALSHTYFKCSPAAAPPTLPKKSTFEYATVRKKKKHKKSHGHNPYQRNRVSTKRSYQRTNHQSMWESGNQNHSENIAQIFSNQFQPKDYRSYRPSPHQQFRQRHQENIQAVNLSHQSSFQQPYQPDVGGWRAQPRPNNSFPPPHRQQPSKTRHASSRNRPS